MAREWLYVAAGIDPQADDAATRKQKVARLWREPATQQVGSRPLPYCDGIGSVREGSALWFAVDTFSDEHVELLVREGADINLIDSRNGRTVLDELWDMIDGLARGKEGYGGPGTWSSLVPRQTRVYHNLRELGARHAVELAHPGPSVAEQQQACLRLQPGDAPARASSYSGGPNANLSDLTPAAVAGATTVSPRQAACLMTALGDKLFVLGVIGDQIGLPGAIMFPPMGSSTALDGPARAMATQMAQIIQGKPVLVYCHSDQCFLSYNAALRLADAGVKTIYWLRDGIKGWRDGGYPTEVPDSMLYRIATRRQ